MKLQILSLRDIKADAYNTPIFAANINATLRDLRDLINDPQGKEPWQKHPEDFELWHIGEFDTDDGHIWTVADGDNWKHKQLLALSTLVNT